MGTLNPEPGSTLETSHRFTAIDLFSGCGGLTTGLLQAGFRVVGAVEIDPLAVETYRLNHDGVAVWRADIRHVNTSEVMNRLRARFTTPPGGGGGRRGSRRG